MYEPQGWRVCQLDCNSKCVYAFLSNGGVFVLTKLVGGILNNVRNLNIF